MDTICLSDALPRLSCSCLQFLLGLEACPSALSSASECLSQLGSGQLADHCWTFHFFGLKNLESLSICSVPFCLRRFEESKQVIKPSELQQNLSTEPSPINTTRPIPSFISSSPYPSLAIILAQDLCLIRPQDVVPELGHYLANKSILPVFFLS